MTIASVLLHSATRQLNFHFNQYGRLSRYVNHIVGFPVVRKTCNDVRTESIHGASRAAPLLSAKLRKEEKGELLAL